MTFPSDPQLITHVNSLIDDFFASNKGSPGLSVAVFDQGHVIHQVSRGVKNQESAQPVAADTVFRIASMTKSFTATAILQLAAVGQLALDDPVTEHLPAFTARYEGMTVSGEITIRHLLTMSSGLGYDDPWADRQEPMTSAEFAAMIATGFTLETRPGTHFAYSSLGFAILGAIIESATGELFTDYVTAKILTPLQLTNTYFDYREVPPAQLATGYSHATGHLAEEPFTTPGAFSAIGGLLSTPADIARWTHWLASALHDNDAGNDAGNGAVSVTGTDDAILPRALRRNMQQAHRVMGTMREIAQLPDDAPVEHRARVRSYGFGLFIEESQQLGTVIHHPGGYPGFGSSMRWHPKSGWGIVAFGNVRYAPVRPLTDEILTAILVARKEKPSAVTLAGDLLAAQQAVMAVLVGRDDAHAAAAFADNVVLDRSPAVRHSANAVVLAEAGEINTQPLPPAHIHSPAHISWTIPAANGGITVDVKLTPTTPRRIHTYTLTAEE